MERSNSAHDQAAGSLLHQSNDNDDDDDNNNNSPHSSLYWDRTSSTARFSNDEGNNNNNQLEQLDDNNKDDDDDDNDNDDNDLEKTSSKRSDTLKKMVRKVLPKVEPLPWSTFFCLSVWCAIPAIAYILLFTQMGYGEHIYYKLSRSSFADHAPIFAGILTLSIFFFYILDIDQWTTTSTSSSSNNNNNKFGHVFRFLSAFTIFSIFVLLVILVSNEFPYGIITLFAILNPLYLLLVKSIFYSNNRGNNNRTSSRTTTTSTRTFVTWLSGPLVVVSVLIMVSFIVWVVVDYSNEWNDVTKVEAAERTGCDANFDEYPNCSSNTTTTTTTCFSVDYSVQPQEELVFPNGCDRSCLKVYDSCSNGFILWAGPVMLCLSTLFLGFFCTFLRIGEGSTDEKDMFNFTKVWLFVLFIMWASASLSGAAAGVTTTLLTLTMANMIGSSILLAAIFSREEIHDNKEMVLEKIRTKYGNDNLNIARGLFVVTCSPVLLGYFCLSAVNQVVRRIGINPCSQPANNEVEGTTTAGDDRTNGILTVRAERQLARMRAWNRAKVYTYAIYWGIAFMILSVLVSKLTVVFLSWIIEKVEDFNLIAVTAIMAVVGAMMFLLPPVPGVPVYLALGIVLPSQGYKILGWPGAILYSTGVGLVLKLFSSALEQKLIGENLSHYVKVRQFVGINSKLMKAMRLELGSGGISVAKVAILIGGPDWPTSVLCGIMRLSLFQIMLGTIPIVFLIFPTCLTGALLYMSSRVLDNGNPEFPWAGTASTLTASVTAMVQFGSMLVAAYYLERTSESRADEVEAIEDDKEVKEADEKDEHMRKCYETVTQWNAVPLWPKLILTFSLLSITASCYMVQFLSEMCFVPHELTDTIDDNLGGNIANLFLPLGWAAVALFLVCTILLYIFSSWGKRRAQKLVESGQAMPLNNQSENL